MSDYKEQWIIVSLIITVITKLVLSLPTSHLDLIKYKVRFQEASNNDNNIVKFLKYLIITH